MTGGTMEPREARPGDGTPPHGAPAVITMERQASPPPPPPPDPVTTRVRLAGEILVTIGVVLLLFVVYEVWVTNWFTDARQDAASDQLVRNWATVQRAPSSGPVPLAPAALGAPIARLTAPTLGPGHAWVVVEGTGTDQLRTGPGHYQGSGSPGLPGDFAVAGHRVGRGAPFDDLGELHSCDPLVVETPQGWAVYRVLPYDDEVAGWATGRGARPECRGVTPLAGVPGRQIVVPSDVGVIAPVPNQPGLPAAEPLITLTTCNPKFSARQRLVVHGALDRFVPRTDGGGLPPELTADR